MRIEIVHKVKGKSNRTVTFTGTNCMVQGMEYITYNQPIEVVAVRVLKADPEVTKEMREGLAWKG